VGKRKTRRVRVYAPVVNAPLGLVKSIGMDSFELDFGLLEKDNVYYAFSVWDVYFLAKKENEIVKVFEAHETKDGRIIAWELYEVEIK